MTVQATRPPARPEPQAPARVRHDGETDWQVAELDLEAYLDRIGYRGPREATGVALAALHRAHTEAIAFENVEVALGRPVPLDLPSLQRKFVRDRRGGYCFEHNLLFAAALERLGFQVERHLARVRRGSTVVRYRAHAFLRVTAQDGLWLADVGFGDEGLIEPIAFEPGAVARCGGWTWRLTDEGEHWVLQALHPDRWFDLYAFRLERHVLPDFEVSNHFTATHPRSTFVGRLIAMRGRPRVRHTLVDRELTTRRCDGREERIELHDDAVVRALRELFGVPVSAEDAHELCQRLPALGTARR
ncbi:arylamine N-acetyltransferase family protein [Actinocrinis sp.]|uniref:arylamine N-acetyltransferase family protein n=1 Tax=Actinocrinis sp. TaxID=1920516 RepID=UPI002D2A99B9|nr:arylamine N-acetyltransferase [Actinocrinis sp.]HZP51745.1 arylamine N-acetyltransferase [Actinocrinis sp.]